MSEPYQRIKIVGPEGYVFQQNVAFGAFVYTNCALYKIHIGKSFTYRDTIELDSTDIQNYLITTPDTTEWAHIGYEIDSNLKVTFELFEATDKTGTTLQTTVFNRNRNSSLEPTTIIHKDISGGTTDGTLLSSRTSGSASAAAKMIVQIGDVQERVLKQNTKYIFRITSGANSNVISARFSWYEHTDIH